MFAGAFADRDGFSRGARPGCPPLARSPIVLGDPRPRFGFAASVSGYGIMYGMKRTTIYLPDGLKAALARTAAATGTSEAEIVRNAVAAATAEHAYPPPKLPLFASGDQTLAERVDDALTEGFGE
jgi:hypothetical protein